MLRISRMSRSFVKWRQFLSSTFCRRTVFIRPKYHGGPSCLGLSVRIGTHKYSYFIRICGYTIEPVHQRSDGKRNALSLLLHVYTETCHVVCVLCKHLTRCINGNCLTCHKKGILVI